MNANEIKLEILEEPQLNWSRPNTQNIEVFSQSYSDILRN